MEAKIASLLRKKKRAEGSKRPSQLNDHLNVSCQLLVRQRIEFAKSSISHSPLEELKKRYQPLNRTTNPLIHATMDTVSRVAHESEDKDGAAKPKIVLFDDKKLVMHWMNPRPVGAGLSNLGNTCFLNSVLQCLMYTPPLFNQLTGTGHTSQCHKAGFCSLCELERHIRRALEGGVIKPIKIVQNLKAIGKHFRLGSQEDAHEFLRYFVDSMQKSCLHGLPPKMDVLSKATTLVHSIFGGYLRSRVTCLECMNDSDTYDQLLDLSLDVKSCPSIEKALHKAIQPDVLDGANKYACPSCKKLCKAKKYFTIHRLPRVMTLHLKRFSFNSLYGSKLTKVVQYSERLNLRPFTSSPKGPAAMYKLYAVLVHSGFSCHSGHYFCFVRSSNNFWHCMNDSSVRQAPLNTVLNQEAYLLFYVRETPLNTHHQIENMVSEQASTLAMKTETTGGLVKKNDPFGLVAKKNDPSGLVAKKNDPSGLVAKKNDPSGLVAKKNESSGLVAKKNDPSGLVAKKNDPSGLVKKTESSGLVKKNESSGLVKKNESSGLVKKKNETPGPEPSGVVATKSQLFGLVGKKTSRPTGGLVRDEDEMPSEPTAKDRKEGKALSRCPPSVQVTDEEPLSNKDRCTSNSSTAVRDADKSMTVSHSVVDDALGQSHSNSIEKVSVKVKDKMAASKSDFFTEGTEKTQPLTRPKPTGVVNPSPQKTLTHSRLQQSLQEVASANIPLRKSDNVSSSSRSVEKPKGKVFSGFIPRNVTLSEKQRKIGIKSTTGKHAGLFQKPPVTMETAPLTQVSGSPSSSVQESDALSSPPPPVSQGGLVTNVPNTTCVRATVSPDRRTAVSSDRRTAISPDRRAVISPDIATRQKRANVFPDTATPHVQADVSPDISPPVIAGVSPDIKTCYVRADVSPADTTADKHVSPCKNHRADESQTCIATDEVMERKHTPGLGMLPPTLRGDPSKVAVVPPTSHAKPVARVQPSVKTPPTFIHDDPPSGVPPDPPSGVPPDPPVSERATSEFASGPPDRIQMHFRRDRKHTLNQKINVLEPPNPPSGGKMSTNATCPVRSVECGEKRDSSSSHHKHKKHKKHKKHSHHRDHSPLHRDHSALHRDHSALHRNHSALHRDHSALHCGHSPLHQDRRRDDRKSSRRKEHRREGRKHSAHDERRVNKTKEKKHSHHQEDEKESKKLVYSHRENGDSRQLSHYQEDWRMERNKSHRNERPTNGHSRPKEERPNVSRHQSDLQTHERGKGSDSRQGGGRDHNESELQRPSLPRPERLSSSDTDSPAPVRKRKVSTCAETSLDKKPTLEQPNSEKSQAEVVRWDEGGRSRQYLMASTEKHHKIFEHLEGQSTHRMGSAVKSWDGGEGFVDSQKLHGDRKRGRSEWDAEFDKGKVKKVKKTSKSEKYDGTNPFQKLQNRKNEEKKSHSHKWDTPRYGHTHHSHKWDTPRYGHTHHVNKHKSKHAHSHYRRDHR